MEYICRKAFFKHALATKRMVEEAKPLGADAIVNIRYASSAVMQGAAEVIVYGTAVKFI
ncbi:MAG: YbjQ family protein [Eubacterium sp.]|nr:YbjQ family protein [Eubacterium sp.]